VAGYAEALWSDQPDLALDNGLSFDLAVCRHFDVAIVRRYGVGQEVTSLGPGHGTVGLLVIVLVVIRAIWWTVNRNRRPVQSTTVTGRAAAVVHASFYLLMFSIPALALLRAYCSGKGWAPWVPASGIEVMWMIMPADLLHSLLAWVLSVLIAGHVTMALIHRFALNDQTFGRMVGRLARATADE
jgi:cytochrome b561